MQFLKTVPVAELPTGSCFPTRFGGDLRQLQSSIQTYGILHPPRVYQGHGEKPLILDGAERVKIARELGLGEIPCYFYDSGHLSRMNAFLLCLELNRLSRTYNIVEKAQLLREAHFIFSGDDIPKIFWNTVEIPHNIRAMQQYKNVLRLPATVQKYAVNNGVPLSAILLFLHFRAEEIERLSAILFKLPLNQNKLAEILSLLQDIVQHEEKSVLLILDDIMPNLELEFSPNQKVEKLRHLLKLRRNPNYEKQLADFEKRVKKLPLNENTKVRPAPFFEENYVEVTTRFANQQDVNNFIDSLKDRSWNEFLKREA